MHISLELGLVLVLVVFMICVMLLLCVLSVRKFADFLPCIDEFQLGEYDPNLYDSEITRSP